MGEEDNMKIGKHLNKFGCYENQEFIGFNEYMLFKSKRLLDQAQRLNQSDGLVEKAVKDHEERIIEIIRKNERELWGFKNPTMIYTLPYFHHHLKNPYYISLKRDSKSIANSLKRAAKFKNWLPEMRHEFLYFSLIEKLQIIMRFIKVFLKSGFIFTHESLYEEIAEDGYRRIDDFLKDKRHIDLKLIDLLEDSENTLRKIIDFLGMTPSEKQIRAALSFIRPDLIKS